MLLHMPVNNGTGAGTPKDGVVVRVGEPATGCVPRVGAN